MVQYDCVFHPDKIDPTVFLASGVVILGDVTIGSLSSVWYNSVIRGDSEYISIGNSTNIQDACVLHADPGVPCRLGDRVTVGHGAVVHGAEVAADVIIGMRAVVLNRAQIGSGSIIGAGALVTERAEIPPNSLVFGVPGRVIRTTSEADRERIVRTAEHYVEAAREFRRQVCEIPDE